MLNRRGFIKTATWTTAGLMLSDALWAQDANLAKKASDRLGEILPQRALGSTGQNVTILGMGGHHMVQLEEKQSQAVIEMALEEGVRFFDTAASYHDGLSETRYGQMLTPRYRDVVYIMTKTGARDAATARSHLDGSLKRMKLDYLDLWQIHAVRNPEDVDNRLEQGVLDVVLEAKEKGKVRHIGFTGHRSNEAHLRMLEKTDVLQTCQMPINVLDPSHESFIKNVLPTLVERKMGVIAMKTAAFGKLFQQGIIPDRISLEDMHHFVWSLPVSVLVGGFDDIDQFRDKVKLARSFRGISNEDRQQLVQKVADKAGFYGDTPETLERYKAGLPLRP